MIKSKNEDLEERRRRSTRRGPTLKIDMKIKKNNKKVEDKLVLKKIWGQQNLKSIWMKQD
jgi:hypothetical protein